MTKLIMSAALVALALGVSQPVAAQTADYQTYFTFSGPVTVPGATLPAGRYLFRLADPSTSRKVINILTADGKKSVAMLTSIPNRLPKAPNDPEVRFMEASGNTPPPIKTWWYPGNSIGYEFIYPRRQALELAKVVREPILTTSGETKPETGDLARVTASGSPTAVQPEENPVAVAATGRVQQGQIPEAPARAQATQPQPETRIARATLPQTASGWPLVSLLGVAAVFAGLGLLRRQPQV